MNTKAKKVTVNTIDFKLTPELSNFVQRHMEKLETLSDRIVECRVLLRLDKSSITEDKVCEITLMMPGKDLFVSKDSQSFEESVVVAIDAIKHQLEHWKSSISGSRDAVRNSIEL
jgi:putative sigma-54 modulation protein